MEWETYIAAKKVDLLLLSNCNDAIDFKEYIQKEIKQSFLDIINPVFYEYIDRKDQTCVIRGMIKLPENYCQPKTAKYYDNENIHEAIKSGDMIKYKHPIPFINNEIVNTSFIHTNDEGELIFNYMDIRTCPAIINEKLNNMIVAVYSINEYGDYIKIWEGNN